MVRVKVKARVGSYIEAPSWMRERYVLSGYRLDYSLREALASIFHFHNESGANNKSAYHNMI